MELTSEEAFKILNDARGTFTDDKWIEHSICVGNTAGKIAEALKLDSDYVKTLGYMHDIGKSVGSFLVHDINGYNLLKDKGYDEKYYNVCMTHSYLNNDIRCTAGGIPESIPFRVEFLKNHEYTLEEKIINLCDLMCTEKVVTIEKRLIDIINRRGAYDNTQYHVQETFKLKEYIDSLLGYNLYDLFPEIKDNL